MKLKLYYLFLIELKVLMCFFTILRYSILTFLKSRSIKIYIKEVNTMKKKLKPKLGFTK